MRHCHAARRYGLPVLLVLLAIAISGCQGKNETPTAQQSTAPTAAPAGQPASGAPGAASPAASLPAPASASTIASGEYSADPNLRCELTEVRRVSGGALLVKWRVVNASGAQAKPIHYDFGWQELYYIDPAENKKYEFLKDSEGNRILDVFYGNLETGQQRGNWAKFPAPPESSNKISIYIPKFPPFEDVPVS